MKILISSNSMELKKSIIISNYVIITFITYEYRNELAEYLRENNFDIDFIMMVAMDPVVVCYRSVKDDIRVRPVAEYFGGKGHDKAGSNPINEEVKNELVRVLTKK